MILDDDTDMGPLTSQLVKTDPYVGLTAPLAELALEILCRPPTPTGPKGNDAHV